MRTPVSLGSERKKIRRRRLCEAMYGKRGWEVGGNGGDASAQISPDSTMSTNQPDRTPSAPEHPSMHNGQPLPPDWKVSEDGAVSCRKDGEWVAAGECPNCTSLGASGDLCENCGNHGVRYEVFETTEVTFAERTDQPNQVPAASEPRVLSITDEDGDIPSLPGQRVISVSLHPVEFEEDGNLKVFHDGQWHVAGECGRCGQFGPVCAFCGRCKTRGILYLPTTIARSENELKIGLMALCVHAELLEVSDPVASHAHFVRLLDTLWARDLPELE